MRLVALARALGVGIAIAALAGPLWACGDRGEAEPTDIAAGLDAEGDTSGAIDADPARDTEVDAETDADPDAEVDPGVDGDSDVDAEVSECAAGLCQPPDPCLATSCAPDGACAYALSSTAACCYDAVLATEDAESPDASVLIVDLAPSAAPPIGWTRSAHRAFDGDFAWYFGDPDALDFDNGARVAGRLELPPVALPADRPSRLVLHVFADVEPGSSWDLLVVRAVADGASLPVYVKDAELAVGAWQRLSVDLAAFAGRTVRLQLDFDSVEASLNATEGLYVDAIWVLSGCEPAPACGDAAECDDGVYCTDDACAAALCAYAPVAACCALAADCDDGDPCTEDTCSNHACVHVPATAAGCCDCDDGDPCTVDACQSDVCTHEPSPALACCQPSALSETFEQAFTAWVFAGSSADCGWYVSASPPAGAEGGALAYGNGANYDCGASQGLATSPTLHLAADTRWTLHARVWFETEPSADSDQLGLVAVAPGGAELSLWRRPPGTTPQKKWTELTLDLSSLAGLAVTLQWRFDTVDSFNNGKRGPYIDRIAVVSDCAPRVCAGPADCDDGLDATADACVGSACAYSLPSP